VTSLESQVCETLVTIDSRFQSETEQTAFPERRYYCSVMPVRKKPDPELLPIHRPRCPDCQARMITVDVATGPEGFERRTFECRKCGHAEIDIVACDPFELNAADWIDGEASQHQQ
jgi:hypothetical protein